MATAKKKTAKKKAAGKAWNYDQRAAYAKAVSAE